MDFILKVSFCIFKPKLQNVMQYINSKGKYKCLLNVSLEAKFKRKQKCSKISKEMTHKPELTKNTIK